MGFVRGFKSVNSSQDELRQETDSSLGPLGEITLSSVSQKYNVRL